MKLGAKPSQKLQSLIDEVERTLDTQISFEVVDSSYFNFNERGHLDYREEFPIVRIDERYYDLTSEGQLTEDTERLIAHELLHLKCKQDGYPSIRLPKVLWQEDKTTHYLRDAVSTIVEHCYVYAELEKYGFPAEGSSDRLEKPLREKPLTDYREPSKHLNNAFHIAEYMVYDNYKPSFIEYLTASLPNTYNTVTQIIDAIKGKPLDPDAVRRTFIRLIRLIDKLDPEMNPPASKRFIVDLVVSERQLQSPARQMLNIEQFSVNSKNLHFLMIALSTDNIYFSGTEEPKPIGKKAIEDIHNAVRGLTLKEFLDRYSIQYTVRKK